MANGPEHDQSRPESRPRDAGILRQAARTVIAFAFLSLASLVGGISRTAMSGWSAASSAAPNAAPNAGARSGQRANATPLAASRVAADSFWSNALGTRKRFVVYLPPSYETSAARRYPVAYYLHGLGGDEWNWVRTGRLDRTLDSLARGGVPEMIVVMPDGDDGWYTTWNHLGNNAECRRTAPPFRQGESVDAYCVPWPKYDDYITRDLVARVDSVYRTLPSRDHRAIAGLSMGGYGAISLALAYPDVFAAAASHSGVLSPLYVGPHPHAAPARYASNERELRENAANLWPSMRLAFGRDTMGWWARDPGRRAARYGGEERRPMPALMIDVGTGDPYVDQSRDLHATLERLGAAHTYAEWPGAHDWTYWRRHAAESLRWIGARIGGQTAPGR
jgi:S-formylglutathione hydrolase FrmB